MSVYRLLLRGANRVRDRVRKRLISPARKGSVEIDGAHLSESIRRAERTDVPSPHIYIPQLFASADYRRLLDSLPKSDRMFDYWIDRPSDATKGVHGEYRKRFDLNLDRAALRIPGDAGRFWQAMHDLLTQRSVVRELLTRYDDLLQRRYGRVLTDADLDELIGTKIFLMRHAPGYYLGPHTDRADRIATLIAYLPADDSNPDLGTTFFNPRETIVEPPGARPHYTFDKFEAVKTTPYLPNSAVFFPQTDYGFHGVLPLAKDRQASVRYGMQIQIFDRKAKAAARAKEY
jgi:hypothetical protein